MLFLFVFRIPVDINLQNIARQLEEEDFVDKIKSNFTFARPTLINLESINDDARKGEGLDDFS